MQLVDCESGKTCVPAAIGCPAGVPSCRPRFEGRCVNHRRLFVDALPRGIIYATADEADAYYVLQMFFSVFCFFLLFPSVKNTRQPLSGTAERIFMKLLPNDSEENVLSNVVPKWGLGPKYFWGLKTTHCALGGNAWRVTEN